MGFRRSIRRGYRRTFGHKSPYRRVYGSRHAGQAIGVSYRQLIGPAERIGKIAAEVRGIKSRLNVEKKHRDELQTVEAGVAIGQVNADAEGMVGFDVTPGITQGTDSHQRVGNSLKLTGMAYKYQLIGQPKTMTSRKVKFTLVKVSSADIASVNWMDVRNHIWDVNPLTNVRDTGAPFNYSSLKNNGIKIIRQHTCYLGRTTIDTGNDGSHGAYEERPHKEGRFAAKMQDLCRYTVSSDAQPEGHRYFLFIQMDVGNSHATSNSTKADIVQPGMNTGAVVRIHSRAWWVDN